MGVLRKILGLLTPFRSAVAKHTQWHTHRGKGQWPTPLLGLLGTGMVLLILTADAGSAKTFATADLVGRWSFFSLISRGNLGGWGYGTFTFDASGACIGAYITSTGHSESPNGTLMIDGDGIIKALDFGGLTSTFHGVMSNRKDMVVSTGTGGDGSYQLHLFVKTGGTFSTSDLEGTWVYHGLISGNEPDQVPGWYYGSMTIDKSGNTFSDSPIVDSEGNNHYIPHGGILSITEEGIVTEPTQPGEAPFFHGAMNQSKDMMVCVATMAPGSIEDVRGYNLLVMQKQASGGYATSDLAGTWYWHGLATGDYAAYKGWFHATALVDSSGNIVMDSYLNRSGDTYNAVSGTMNIRHDGIVTIPGKPDGHGAMNIGKDIVVMTMNDGGGGYDLTISVGRPADEFDFNGDGRVDFIDLAIFSSHWLN